MRETETDRDRQRERDTHTDRGTHTHTDRHIETEGQRKKNPTTPSANEKWFYDHCREMILLERTNLYHLPRRLKGSKVDSFSRGDVFAERDLYSQVSCVCVGVWGWVGRGDLCPQCLLLLI